MAGIDDWLSVARADDPDDVRERILTGYRDGKPFTPYVPTLAMPASVNDCPRLRMRSRPQLSLFDVDRA